VIPNRRLEAREPARRALGGESAVQLILATRKSTEFSVAMATSRKKQKTG
jgi:hypothetical protein